MSALAAFFEPEVNAWRGRAPLWRVFWLHGAAASLLLLAFLLLELRDRHFLQMQLGLFAFVAYTAWLLVAVWRCMPNADPFWSDLARVTTVAWAANTVMLSVFLEVDLLGGLL